MGGGGDGVLSNGQNPRFWNLNFVVPIDVFGVILFILLTVYIYSRGEVCTMAPLHMHSGMKDHSMYEYSLLALATLTKVD